MGNGSGGKVSNIQLLEYLTVALDGKLQTAWEQMSMVGDCHQDATDYNGNVNVQFKGLKTPFKLSLDNHYWKYSVRL